jgi:sugar-specific transcriptional regulator TrmB
MKSDSREIIHALELYGFTKNEADVYVFLLKRTEATAFDTARGTGIPRSTVYTILESLKSQGVVSQFRKNNVAYYTPESPNQLMLLLKKKEEIINDVMPQIRAIASRTVDTPITKLFVGLDGIKAGLEDILETLRNRKIKQICATSQPDLLAYLPKYFPNWLKSREDLSVLTKLILPSAARNYLKDNPLREVRFFPEQFPFTCSVTIYGDKMAFFSLEGDEPYCIMIESTSIVGIFTQFFAFSWESLKKP